MASGADGRWREHTLALETASLSPPTWTAPTCSTQAVTRFAAACADQAERDRQALADAVASGRITDERDI